ncbi:uncharacterized protein LOC118348597 [Juglans regia]|uniref:Uncharacterized protein LOC118348597 n=1 Tax=Juglans regia TaxID=51240 RepID=A0A6P9EE53_JUGRE|nr:uncharacterized protein LOC118348597 [Juglans regia]
MWRSRNVFIRMTNEQDFVKAISRESCEVNGIQYRVFHWNPEFNEDEEPSLVPVWIVLPGLPPNFYHESFLKIFTAPIGKFIRRDNTTKCATHTDGARLCLEMDASKEPISYFWIGMPGSGRKQEIIYETLPAFCTHCKIQGHNDRTCKLHNRRDGEKIWIRKNVKDFEEKKIEIQAENNVELDKGKGVMMMDAGMAQGDTEKIVLSQD